MSSTKITKDEIVNILQLLNHSNEDRRELGKTLFKFRKWKKLFPQLYKHVFRKNKRVFLSKDSYNFYKFSIGKEVTSVLKNCKADYKLLKKWSGIHLNHVPLFHSPSALLEYKDTDMHHKYVSPWNRLISRSYLSYNKHNLNSNFHNPIGEKSEGLRMMHYLINGSETGGKSFKDYRRAVSVELLLIDKIKKKIKKIQYALQ
jgi:hypothetical protein